MLEAAGGVKNAFWIERCRAVLCTPGGVVWLGEGADSRLLNDKET